MKGNVVQATCVMLLYIRLQYAHVGLLMRQIFVRKASKLISM